MVEDDFTDLSLEEISKKIRNMEIRGAAKIGRAAAWGLKNAVSDFKGGNIEDLKDVVKKSEERLKSTRPTAVSLHNAIRYVLKGSSEDVEKRKKMIISRADEFIESSINAGKKIAEYGGGRINDGDVILTHCNSSIAIGCIKYAWREGKDIEVISTESRPKRQGYITVRELADEGIPVTLIVDSAVRHKMTDIDKVYVGADSIASNGAVINKIGTSQIALCAHEARVDFTVCAETYKFSSETVFGKLVDIEERDPEEIVDPKDFPGVNISNPVFDATPAKYVDAIITEEGVISPSYAYKIIKEMEE